MTKEKDSDKLTLNGILNQRSQDVLAANNWNVCQYAVLLHMLAQDTSEDAGYPRQDGKTPWSFTPVWYWGPAVHVQDRWEGLGWRDVGYAI